MIAVDGSGLFPEGTYKPTVSIGLVISSQLTPGITSILISKRFVFFSWNFLTLFMAWLIADLLWVMSFQLLYLFLLCSA
jgi:hypothetical protein